MHILLLLIFMIGIVTGNAVSADVENMIRNPGFERGDESPAGWQLGQAGRGAGSAKWVIDDPHSGEYCVRLEMQELGDYWMARQRLQAGTALPNHSYRIHGWYRGTSSATHPCVYFRDKEGQFIDAWEATLRESDDWRPFDFVFETPAKTDHFELQLRAQGRKGVCWFDDVSLQDAAQLMQQGRKLVAPLLQLADGNPQYLWTIVSSGGRVSFQLAGGIDAEIAYALASGEEADAAGDYEITMMHRTSDGDDEGRRVLARPRHADEHLHRVSLSTEMLPADARAVSISAQSRSSGSASALLVGLRGTDRIASRLADIEAARVGEAQPSV